jgi:hypothetical protein
VVNVLWPLAVTPLRTKVAANPVPDSTKKVPLVQPLGSVNATDEAPLWKIVLFDASVQVIV